MTSPDDFARTLDQLSSMSAEERAPEVVALMRELWATCITAQTVAAVGPAVDLVRTGVDEGELLDVIRKAALESLIAALVTLDREGITPGLAPSVYLGDLSGTDGAPFNY